MKVLSSASYKGSRIYNGDVIGIKDNMCFVMDGSTALFNDFKFYPEGDLYKYMQFLKDNFENKNEIVENLQNAIRLSNKKMNGIEKYEEYELPTYTIAVVKESNEYLEYYILCDTLISILYKDGHIENIEDRRIDSIKELCRRRNREIKEMNITDEEKKKLVLENEREIRKTINKSNGFPVGSTKVDSVMQGIKGKIDKNLIDRILICSDGYYDSEDGYPQESYEFDKEYIENRINEILQKDVRDDLSYILLEL